MPLIPRRDGDLVDDVPAYRRAMQLIMRRRNDAFVLFEQHIDAGPGLAFIAEFNQKSPHKITFFHLCLHALVKMFHEHPRLNRFTMGGRLYQRRGIWVAFSAKKAMNDEAPVVVVKQAFDPGDPFEAMVAKVAAGVSEGRSDKKSTTDKELGLLFKLPLFVASGAFRLLAQLDGWNLLPRRFIETDPMYASAFIANLGSLKLDAAFHHHYEYGNIPVFLTIGQVHDAVVAREDGSAGTRKQITLRWTYDERVEDGLYCARAIEKIREQLEAPRPR